MAARRAKVSSGVITRCFTRPRPAFFTRYTTRPSRRTPKRASENAGRTRDADRVFTLKALDGQTLSAEVTVTAWNEGGAAAAEDRTNRRRSTLYRSRDAQRSSTSTSRGARVAPERDDEPLSGQRVTTTRPPLNANVYPDHWLGAFVGSR
jgi:hypothetical protein